MNPQYGGYVALCRELDIASQGDSVDEALANLKEAVELFLETAPLAEIRARLKGAKLPNRIKAVMIEEDNSSNPPRDYTDYEVTIDPSAIPDGVEVIERI